MGGKPSDDAEYSRCDNETKPEGRENSQNAIPEVVNEPTKTSMTFDVTYRRSANQEARNPEESIHRK
jgi:hypothetical protein